MTKPIARASHNMPKSPARLTIASRKIFLAHLSETANVTASAKAAGFTTAAVYAERRRLPHFRAEWADALAEGYAKLEANLLAEALQTASAKTSDAMLKARTQKNRLGLSLLGWHRASVKSAPVAAPAISSAELPLVKAQLILRLTEMRQKAGLPLAALPAPPEKGAHDVEC